MKWKITRKFLIASVLNCFLFLMIPSAAHSWNQVTHAYIAERLGAAMGHDNLGEMWGSVNPDLYNYIFDSGLCPDWISDQTHGATDQINGTVPESFMKVWNAAGTNTEKALAYGFLTHNQAWGADYTAHISGITFGQEEGYIITKEKLLYNTPFPDNSGRTFGEVFESLGMNPDQGLLIAHLISEEAVDILVRNNMDPLIGWKLALAARMETRPFSALLIDAFAADYADHCFAGDGSTAAEVLAYAEKEHRKNMIFLGQAVSQSVPVAAQLLSEQIVDIIPGFMGKPLPVPEADAVALFETAIYSALNLCSDYRSEVEATIAFVGKNLENRGITY